MGSNGAFAGNAVVDGLETSIEINIKTLDSQTYTLRVDKQVTLLALLCIIFTIIYTSGLTYLNEYSNKLISFYLYGFENSVILFSNASYSFVIS